MKYIKNPFIWFGLLTFALICLAIASTDSKAAEPTFVPLQVAQAGTWYDPAFPGEGFTIDVVPQTAGAFASVIFYGGARTADTEPFWLISSPPWRGSTSGTRELDQTTHLLRSGDDGTLLPVGTINVSSVDCTHLSVDVQLPEYSTPTQPLAHYDLVPLTLPNASECFSCPVSGPSPPDVRCMNAPN